MDPRREALTQLDRRKESVSCVRFRDAIRRSVVGRITGYTVSDEHPTVCRVSARYRPLGGHVCTVIGARCFRYRLRSCGWPATHTSEAREKKNSDTVERLSSLRKEAGNYLFFANTGSSDVYCTVYPIVSRKIDARSSRSRKRVSPFADEESLKYLKASADEVKL